MKNNKEFLTDDWTLSELAEREFPELEQADNPQLQKNVYEIINNGADKIEGIVIGKIISINTAGQVLVDFPFNPAEKPLEAITATEISDADINEEVALLFENGNPLKPLIIGRMFQPDVSRQNILANIAAEDEEPMETRVDGKQITFNAEKEIVLRCGKSSITLTKAGKIILRGKYLLSRSSGVNRIKGGSVQIN